MSDDSQIAKLKGVHPKLIAATYSMLHAAAELGHPIMVTDGVRTVEQQQELYSHGRNGDTRLVVTYADGVTNKSNHQLHEDGFGHAVDFAFLDANGRPSWAEGHPWYLIGAMARALGLKWGGDWPTPQMDRPHVELP